MNSLVQLEFILTCVLMLPVYKDGGKEKKRKQEIGKNEGNYKYSSCVKCYFVRTESGWDKDEPYVFSNKNIGEVRKSFMHIHTVPTVAKYVARLESYCFCFIVTTI